MDPHFCGQLGIASEPAAGLCFSCGTKPSPTITPPRDAKSPAHRLPFASRDDIFLFARKMISNLLHSILRKALRVMLSASLGTTCLDASHPPSAMSMFNGCGVSSTIGCGINFVELPPALRTYNWDPNNASDSSRKFSHQYHDFGKFGTTN